MRKLLLAALLAAPAAGQDGLPPLPPKPDGYGQPAPPQPFCSPSACGPEAEGALAFFSPEDGSYFKAPPAAAVRKTQKAYNAWAAARAGEGRSPVRFTRKGPWGWTGGGLSAPARLPEDGKLGTETLLAPAYKQGEQVLRFYDEWQAHCRRNGTPDDREEGLCEGPLTRKRGIPQDASAAAMLRGLMDHQRALKDYETLARAQTPDGLSLDAARRMAQLQADTDMNLKATDLVRLRMLLGR